MFAAGKRNQVSRVSRREPQSLCNPLKDILRRPDIAALFEPRIPSCTDQGKRGNFFAPQSGSPPPSPCRNADELRPYHLAAEPEKFCQLGSALGIDDWGVQHRGSNTRITRPIVLGIDSAQDKSGANASCRQNDRRSTLN